jgi:DNA-directed RNA polymerase I subunit RPA1
VLTGSYSPTFRLDTYSKIIELELDGKRRLANSTVGLKRPKVVGAGAISLTKKPKKEEKETDEGIERSSQSSQSDDDMEVDAATEPEESDEDLGDDDEEEGRVVARTAGGKIKGSRGRNERVMATSEVRQHLRLLFRSESQLCNLLYGRIKNPTRSTASLADMFFMDVIPVAPTRFRPASKMGDDMFENSQNSLLSAVIQTSIRIRTLNARMKEQALAGKSEDVLEAISKADAGRTFELFLEAMIKLQTDVNAFMDSNRNTAPVRQGKLPPPGIKQVLEKKEGLFRKHMMVSTP